MTPLSKQHYGLVAMQKMLKNIGSKILQKWSSKNHDDINKFITMAAGESLCKVMVLVLPSLLKYPHGKTLEELGPILEHIKV